MHRHHRPACYRPYHGFNYPYAYPYAFGPYAYPYAFGPYAPSLYNPYIVAAAAANLVNNNIYR